MLLLSSFACSFYISPDRCKYFGGTFKTLTPHCAPSGYSAAVFSLNNITVMLLIFFAAKISDNQMLKQMEKLQSFIANTMTSCHDQTSAS